MKIKRLYFFILLAISTILIFAQINRDRVVFSDEYILAEMADNMAQTGNYLEPVYMDQIWLEKPPLYAWLTAPLIKLFGNQFWVWRFWSVVSIMGSTLAIYLFAIQLLNPLAGFVAGLFFLTNYYTLTLAHSASMDTLNVFLLTLSFIFLAKGFNEPKKKFFVLSGIFTGLAVLTRSFLGLILVPIAFLSILSLPRQIRFSRLTLFGLSTLTLTLPWHLYTAFTHPQLFFEEYFLLNSLARFNPDFIFKNLSLCLSARHTLLLVFITNLYCLFLFWPKKVLSAFTKKTKSTAKLLIFWLVSYLLILVLAGSNAPWHFLHLLPPLAILAAGACGQLIKSSATGKIVALFILAASLIPNPLSFFGFQKEAPRVEAQKKIAREYPNQTLYSWKKQYLIQNRFFDPQPIETIGPNQLRTTVEKYGSILVFIPRSDQTEIDRSIHQKCIYEQEKFVICNLSL